MVNTVSAAKKMMSEVINKQPEDATYAEILKELAFTQMIEKGLSDSKSGKIISNQEMKNKIDSWN